MQYFHSGKRDREIAIAGVADFFSKGPDGTYFQLSGSFDVSVAAT